MSNFVTARCLTDEHLLKPVGKFYNFTLTTTAATLLSLYNTAASATDWLHAFTAVELQVEGAVRITTDGSTAPTTSTGFKLPADWRGHYSHAEANKMRLISITGGNVVVNLQLKNM